MPNAHAAIEINDKTVIEPLPLVWYQSKMCCCRATETHEHEVQANTAAISLEVGRRYVHSQMFADECQSGAVHHMSDLPYVTRQNKDFFFSNTSV